MLQRLRLCFSSNFSSYPILADTLFGHLCWVICDLEGEAALNNFLQEYETEPPPLLVSDAFPAGFLPRPCLKPISLQQAASLVQDLEPRTGMAKLRALQKVKWLKREVWQRLSFGCNESQLLRQLLVENPTPPPIANINSPHTTIDRFTGQPLKNFYTEEFVGQTYDLYVRLEGHSSLWLHTLLTYLGRIGYGRDHSIGKGQFTVNAPAEWENVEFLSPTNRVLSLATGLPDQQLTDGYYRLLPKYGRLGRHWSRHSLKRPLLLHQAGATYTPVGKIKPYYGSLLKNLHATLPEVRHSTYLLVWPFQEH